MGIKEQQQLIKVMKEVRILADMLGVAPAHNTPSDLRGSPVKDYQAEYIYEAYPKKVGKTKGLVKLNNLIKNGANCTDVLTALSHYKEYVKDQQARGFDLRYKQFDTWVNCWEDFIDPPQTLKREQAALAVQAKVKRGPPPPPDL